MCGSSLQYEHSKSIVLDEKLNTTLFDYNAWALQRVHAVAKIGSCSSPSKSNACRKKIVEKQDFLLDEN